MEKLIAQVNRARSAQLRNVSDPLPGEVEAVDPAPMVGSIG
jgi:hypothetical protein